MAEGLSRMLSGLGVEHRVFWSSLRLLGRPSARFKRLAKEWLSRPLLAQLKNYSAVVVVQHMRDAFRRSLAIDELRQALPNTPIVLYDLDYLPTVGLWGPWLGADENFEAVHGIDRYDWYLCVSSIGRCPMPDGFNPCTQIGVHLDDGSLYPNQNGRFLALIDFERTNHLKERRLQIEALQEARTEFLVLKGRYSMQDIRRIYRQCSVYFLAHMESFGLPICELQACGSHVFTPYVSWCDAHRLGRHDAPLPANFVCYRNDKDFLVEQLRRIKAAASPAVVVRRFQESHPHFFRGDPDSLRGFLDKLERHEIDSQAHRGYAEISRRIPVRPED
ncbi:MAG TPA: hypothetical protein DCZ95_06660 [Verrucomicrobia bacterium]|nr:MAG: hypothetical protein A2X46_10535 [Lentisphaerae bacterium GWF2_57_35]HBA83759.1 hypothetical protein [Verrucomicrobiota bacterium]